MRSPLQGEGVVSGEGRAEGYTRVIRDGRQQAGYEL